jgi:DNA repair protein RecO (recombination protein O)
LLHKTKGIILRSTKYGDTSLITTAYTELFGIQTYLVKGVRQTSKKGVNKASMFQPASLLDMVVYHNELKNLQIIKEHNWAQLYTNLHYDVIKNCVALYMVELVAKCIKQPETNTDIYYFIEAYLLLLDQADAAVTANIPLHFALQLAKQLGFGIEEQQQPAHQILDLQAGRFDTEIPLHGNFIDGLLATATANLLTIENAVSIYRVKLNKQQRQQLLQAYQHFYEYHIADFGAIKSLQVLQAILS